MCEVVRHAAEDAQFIQILARDPGVERGFAVGFGGGEAGWGVGLVETADEVGRGDVGGGDVACWLDGEKFIEGDIGEES